MGKIPWFVLTGWPELEESDLEQQGARDRELYRDDGLEVLDRNGHRTASCWPIS